MGEKLWIKIWGEAYNDSVENSFHAMASFTGTDHDLLVGNPWSSQIHLSSINHINVLRNGTAGTDWPNAKYRPLFYIGIYAAIGLSSVIAGILSVATQYTGALRASRMLFKKLLVTVVRAPMRFHDVTPLGRMLNRFGKVI